MYDVLDDVCHLLPEDKPRYLMGVGRLEQMKTAVAKGIDMFDCVLPMREARHGTIYLSDGSKVRIIGSTFRNDHSILDPNSPSPLSRIHLKSFLCHLLRAGERLGETIACMQNLGITLQMMRKLREDLE
jgi:queuine tRNA-ribosyltransferase